MIIDHRLKVGNLIRTCYKLINGRLCTNWSEKAFVIKIDQNIMRWTCVISDLNGKEIVEKFYEKQFHKNIIQKEFGTEKIN